MGFDAKKAEVAVRFFQEFLTHTKGSFARKPFLLPAWQRKIVGDIFGTVRRDGKRQYRTAYIEIPKKNGKSTLTAGIALYGLLIDEEPGAEIYSAAATRDQASIVFRTAAQMVRQNSTLRDKCRIIDSTKTIYLKDDPSCFYKAISADAGTQDGINPHFVIFDELHRQTKRDLWDVLSFGSDTRVQPLLVAITTAGIASESPVCFEQHEYARQLLAGIFKDPSFYPIIYGLPEEEDWTNEGHAVKGRKRASGWYKANPALGDFLTIERVRQHAEKAKRLPSEQNSFRRLRLNQWVSQETRWISLQDWDKCGKPFNANDLAGKPCWGGLDLSTNVDVTSLVLAFPIDDEIFIIPHFWMPADNLHERSIRDKVTYDLWAAQGLIHVTQGNIIDYGFVRKTVNELGKIYDIREIAHDPWNATQLCLELADDGFTMIPIRQGMQSLSAPSKEFERLVLGVKLRHGGHPVLRWMMDCTSVKQDAAGNVRPVKPDRRTTSKRIDGIVGSIMAVARTMVQPENGGSTYDDHGIITLGLDDDGNEVAINAEDPDRFAEGGSEA